MKIKLSTGEIYEINNGTTIGREGDIRVSPHLTSVSRVHGTFNINGTRVTYNDNSSRFGTWGKNNDRIEVCELNKGRRLYLGLRGSGIEIERIE